MLLHPTPRSRQNRPEFSFTKRTLETAAILLLVCGSSFAGTKEFSETFSDWAAPQNGWALQHLPALPASGKSSDWLDTGSTANWEDVSNWGNGVPGTLGTGDGNGDTADFKFSHNLDVAINSNRNIANVVFEAQAGTFNLHGESLYLTFGGEIWIKSGTANSQTVAGPIFLSSLSTSSVNAFLINASTNPGVTLNLTGPISGRQSTGLTTTLMLDGYGNGLVTGAISDGTAGGKVAVNKSDLSTGSGPSTWTLSAANTYTGATTIASGTLQIGNGGLTGSLSTASTIANNSTLAFNRSDAITQGTDFSAAPISGTGKLTKLGNGALTLTAANSYQGETLVQAGTLLVNNSAGSGTGTGAVTVSNAGSLLGGTGTITGAVTINASAEIEGGSGSAEGSLTLTGALSLSSNSVVQLALGSGGTHSTLTRSGSNTWTFAANQVFHFLDLGAQTGTYQDIVTGVSGTAFTPSAWTIDNPGWHGTFSYDGSGHIDLVLDTLAPAPEPSTWVAGSLALLAVGYTARRRLVNRHAIVD